MNPPAKGLEAFFETLHSEQNKDHHRGNRQSFAVAIDSDQRADSRQYPDHRGRGDAQNEAVLGQDQPTSQKSDTRDDLPEDPGWIGRAPLVHHQTKAHKGRRAQAN